MGTMGPLGSKALGLSDTILALGDVVSDSHSVRYSMLTVQFLDEREIRFGVVKVRELARCASMLIGDDRCSAVRGVERKLVHWGVLPLLSPRNQCIT